MLVNKIVDVVTIAGYRLVEQLYSGSRTLIYRGIRDNENRSVVVKLLKREYPTFSELIHFRHQYTIAKHLNIPGVVRPHSIEPYRNGYALLMEDFGGISLRDYTRYNCLNVNQFLKIAIQLANILNGLYHHRVIHKDIKPANILIHPETQQIQLIDLSISSLLPRETQEIQSPNVLEGTLAYLSPEQTGRMNRGIDYRTDFYSLGVTFYELLTGQLPFESDDPMELVHSHIAKQPISVHQLNSDIPVTLSAVVSKLMAKNAEDRYQSALGLKHDLEKCWLQWEETGKIGNFELGTRDLCDRFIIPEKLYGREAEVKTLLNSFDRVSAGSTEMMLVTGFSGVGKTAVVNEVHKPIVRQRGYFIKGKYEQFQRNIPLSAFVQAFRDLMGQILSESDAQLQQWQEKILTALGENAQVIIEVIPELEKIIGKQPPALELAGTAAQNRFNLLFQNFIQVLTTKEHPLVIFLDDLQWMDSASLNLLKLLITETDTSYLLLIGAYRDNEVFPAHPLMLTLEEIGKAKAIIHTITLAPLSQLDINQLIADTLQCSAELAQPLTQLVEQKTQGNPFFTTHFLKALHEDGWIKLDRQTHYWQCDIAQVKKLALTDDVVEFMAGQLQKLPPQTQEILKLAAAIGNQFDLHTVAIVAEKSQPNVAADLWPALQSGLVIPHSEIYKFYQSQPDTDNSAPGEAFTVTYKFLHDRVQQAAYSLILLFQKHKTHLKIGQLLLSNISEREQEERIFEIVNQLNIGADLITEQAQQERLVQLNLMAGRKAKVSTAYAAAIAYLTAGLKLLASDKWQTQYQLTLSLHQESAEVEYLNTHFEQAEALIQEIWQNATSLLDKIKSYELAVQIYMAEDQQLRAIETGWKLLSKLGIDLSSETIVENIEFQLLLPEELDLAPQMTDPYKLAGFRILSAITPAVHHVKPELFPLIVQAMMNLCSHFGYSEFAAYAHQSYGLYLWSAQKDFVAAYAAGKLGLSILEKYKSRAMESKVNLVFGVFISPCREHIQDSLMALKAGIEAGIEVGDIEHTSYCIMAYFSFLFLSGENLEILAERQNSYYHLVLKLKQGHCIYYSKIWLQLSLNLQKPVSNKFELTGDLFNEKELLSYLNSNHNHQSLFAFYLVKLIWFYTLGEPDRAIISALKAVENKEAAFGLMLVAAHNFYYSLSLLADYSYRPMQERVENLNQVAENQQIMQEWANHAPSNFLHKFYLVEAERDRILGNKTAAREHYDLAITLAKENEYRQEEALANELAAKFYFDWGKEKIAQAYLLDAYYGYARWGASAKVADLEIRYPQLLAPILVQPKTPLSIRDTLTDRTESTPHITVSSASSTKVSETLDLATVLKAFQTLSSQIQLEQLLSTLMEVVMVNAGANRGALILKQDDRWVLAADCSDPQNCTLSSGELKYCTNIPINIINLVKRTGEPLVMDDVMEQSSLAIDPYLMRQRPKSILCSPIHHQGQLMGIIYLENNLVVGAFTSDRVEMLSLLCTQAAISIENARLYQQAQQALHELKQAQLQIVQSEKMSALGNLMAGIGHEINNPISFLSGNLPPAQDYVRDLLGLLDLYQQLYPHPLPAILDEIEAIDLEYLRSDLPKLLNSMNIGIDRIRNISTSLRTFSRADRDYKVPFHIHEGLDSTLLILKHRLKANDLRPEIEVVKKYGDLPSINCFPGQLNQVFMNILANAIDAIDEANEGCSFAAIQADPNRITIQTTSDNRFVTIQIVDNGTGMTEEVKQQMFDHLFTTKAVGKGTGLGLAIAYQIVVEKHSGTIEVNSVPGQGTELILQMPIDV